MAFGIYSEEETRCQVWERMQKYVTRVSAAHFLLKKEALFSSPAVAVLVGSTVLLEKNPGCNLNDLRRSNLKNGAVINEQEML